MSKAPKPPQPLGDIGAAMWRDVWRKPPPWLEADLDTHAVWTLCALHDERARLTLSAPENWRDGVALRRVDAQIERYLDRLGLTPRGRGTVHTMRAEATGKLAELRARNEAMQRQAIAADTITSDDTATPWPLLPHRQAIAPPAET